MDCVPRNRYSYGEEIREYANIIAKKWGLVDSAVFQIKAEKLVWDEYYKGVAGGASTKTKRGQSQALNVRT